MKISETPYIGIPTSFMEVDSTFNEFISHPEIESSKRLRTIHKLTDTRVREVGTNVPETLEWTVTVDQTTMNWTSTSEEDDPEYLTEVEITAIEASISDYAEGRYKEGSLEDLIDDLNSE